MINVNVIVPVANGGRTLENCLKSISKQSYPHVFLTLIVDSRSSDSTDEIAKRYASTVLYSSGERTKKINLALQNLPKSTDFVFWVDADMILHPELIERMVQEASVLECDAFFVPEQIFGKNWNSRIRNFERPYFNGTSVDSVRFLSKTGVQKLGRLDEELFASAGGEEWDIDARIKANGKLGVFAFSTCNALPKWDQEILVYLERFSYLNLNRITVFHDDGDLSFYKFLKKKKYYFQGIQQYQNAKAGDARLEHQKMLSPLYRLFGIYFENSKWKRTVKHPIMYLQILFLRFILGLSFLGWKIVDPKKSGLDPYGL